MRVVIQRAQKAKVEVENNVIGQIDYGLLLLVGFEEKETDGEMDWLINKIKNLRIFNDENGVMNLSLQDISGDILVVSQFTLHASTKKGNRPSYIRAAKPDKAILYYENFIFKLEKVLDKKVQTGQFGADMKVNFTNDGPVTIIIDTKDKDF